MKLESLIKVFMKRHGVEEFLATELAISVLLYDKYGEEMVNDLEHQEYTEEELEDFELPDLTFIHYGKDRSALETLVVDSKDTKDYVETLKDVFPIIIVE